MEVHERDEVQFLSKLVLELNVEISLRRFVSKDLDATHLLAEQLKDRQPGEAVCLVVTKCRGKTTLVLLAPVRGHG